MLHIRRSFVRPTIAAVGLTLLFNNWLLAPLLDPGLSTARSLISEISAATQPFHWVFRAGDIISGLLALALTPLVWQLVRRHDFRGHLLLTTTVAAIGLDSIVDALLPISCAPSADAHCQFVDVHNFATTAHLVESNVAGLLLFATPLLWWWLSRKRHNLLSGVSLLLAVVQLGVGVGILATRMHGIHIEGLFQRAYELSIGAWLGYLAWLSLHHWLDKSFFVDE